MPRRTTRQPIVNKRASRSVKSPEVVPSAPINVVVESPPTPEPVVVESPPAPEPEVVVESPPAPEPEVVVESLPVPEPKVEVVEEVVVPEPKQIPGSATFGIEAAVKEEKKPAPKKRGRKKKVQKDSS